MALPGSYSLKWHGHGIHLNSSISGLYRSDSFTDVVVATADGHYFSAHQFVLSACSPYLHRMFYIASNGSKSNAKAVIVLPSEICHTTLSILLQYIYRGEAIVNHDQLPQIMKAAEILEIRGLCQGKDQQEPKSSSSVLKQQTSKSNQELRNNSEVVKPNHRVLIPEIKYGSESNHISINKNSSGRPTSRNSPRSLSNNAKRAPSSVNSSPDKKKLKKNIERPLLELNTDNEMNIEDSMIEKIIVGEEIQVKEEPVDWEEPKSSDENGTDVKQEVTSDEEVEVEENCYVALTCDLCQETFSTPAMWVRHIEMAHPTTALASGKRANVDDGSGQEVYTPLHCELCQQVFTLPADWVRHIKTHTEEQLAQTNETADAQSNRQRVQIACPVCGKVLQSQASMQIHARTHTGERPYLCKVCGREFNVKSNYLRHMRTLHDQVVNTNGIE